MNMKNDNKKLEIGNSHFGDDFKKSNHIEKPSDPEVRGFFEKLACGFGVKCPWEV